MEFIPDIILDIDIKNDELQLLNITGGVQTSDNEDMCLLDEIKRESVFVSIIRTTLVTLLDGFVEIVDGFVAVVLIKTLSTRKNVEV